MLLLVDDDLDLTFRMEAHFTKNGVPFTVWHDYNDLKKRLVEVRPTVMIFDMNIGQDRDAGLRALEIVRENFPSIRCIVLTDHLEHVTRAFRMGAEGYLHKREFPESVEYVQQVMDDAAAGKAPMTANVRRAVVQHLQPFDRSMQTLLNDREKEILLLAACDHTIPQIAEITGLKRSAAQTYSRNLKAKMNCNTIQGAVGKAFHHRILNPDELLS